MRGLSAAPTPSTSAAPVTTYAPVLPPPATGPSQFKLDLCRDINLILSRLDKLEEDLAEDGKILRYNKKKVKKSKE
ncbi:hypothetical protein NDU88_003375 [Pleurodeles waltl]|uniref:Uncharacterized protein n=1 Tax=Pleurodeles waltl TaxID=8319 RepID=A0AAV7M546_PLEWA|nr:hypothetical protein NDU88_003375 [Pleurodeles waltl]